MLFSCYLFYSISSTALPWLKLKMMKIRSVFLPHLPPLCIPSLRIFSTHTSPEIDLALCVYNPSPIPRSQGKILDLQSLALHQAPFMPHGRLGTHSYSVKLWYTIDRWEKISTGINSTQQPIQKNNGEKYDFNQTYSVIFIYLLPCDHSFSSHEGNHMIVRSVVNYWHRQKKVFCSSSTALIRIFPEVNLRDTCKKDKSTQKFISIHW